MEYRGIDYMREKLREKEIRVDLRYKYYEMKNQIQDFGISTPPNLRAVQSAMGWCAKSVDALADRVVFREFEQDSFGLNTIFNQNNPDVLFDSAILSALISSCSFVYISMDNEGFPRLRVIDGAHATGIADPIVNMLTEGYAILEHDQNGNPTQEAYFVKGRTDFYKMGKLVRSVPNIAPYPLLVPIINRPDAKRPFGHSRISRASMDCVQSAMRTVKRSEISAEFFSFPQKYVVGTSADRDPMDSWRATMSAMMEFTKDEDGDKPSLGQFQQQSMEPHLAQLRMFAGVFAGENDLTLDDLGFPSDNPSSQEAIKASHENLRLKARKAQRCFGTGFLNVGFLAACIRDNIGYDRWELYKTKAVWEPIFEPDASTLSTIGDGAIKINQAVPGYFDERVLRNFTGIDKGV